MIKAILFDFDGTLANTAPGILCTMKETLRTMGLAVPDDETITQTIGLPLVECVAIAGKLPREEAERGAQIYRELFPTFELTHITIFPGVAETVKELSAKGIRLAICTSRGLNSLTRILTRHSLMDKFETAVTASDNLPGKPAPDMVLTLLERMGLKPEEAVVVGDTTYDIQMGQNAGCRTGAVTYGNHSAEQLRSVSPTWIFDDFTRVTEIISR